MKKILTITIGTIATGLAALLGSCGNDTVETDAGADVAVVDAGEPAPQTQYADAGSLKPYDQKPKVEEIKTLVCDNTFKQNPYDQPISGYEGTLRQALSNGSIMPGKDLYTMYKSYPEVKKALQDMLYDPFRYMLVQQGKNHTEDDIKKSIDDYFMALVDETKATPNEFSKGAELAEATAGYINVDPDFAPDAGVSGDKKPFLTMTTAFDGNQDTCVIMGKENAADGQIKQEYVKAAVDTIRDVLGRGF